MDVYKLNGKEQGVKLRYHRYVRYYPRCMNYRTVEYLIGSSIYIYFKTR